MLKRIKLSACLHDANISHDLREGDDAALYSGKAHTANFTVLHRNTSEQSLR